METLNPTWTDLSGEGHYEPIMGAQSRPVGWRIWRRGEAEYPRWPPHREHSVERAREWVRTKGRLQQFGRADADIAPTSGMSWEQAEAAKARSGIHDPTPAEEAAVGKRLRESEYARRNPPLPAEAQALNPKDLVGAKKLPLSLIPRGALIGVARAMAEGARKYGPFNWREQPIQAVTYAEAALRHINEWLDGEDIDPETGDAAIHHIDLAIAGLMIMRDAAICGVLRDNRHVPGNFADALRVATKKD
jgi:hypothetical protein